jgi:N-methylhydantoinase A/oxoprolinase/acetone carboxylase beta subunit
VGGGGSIARRKPDGAYTVGPDSVCASPGPAAYGLGGTAPTATDAEVVLGHIDHDWFLAGRRKLDPGRARAALERIAASDSAEAAAWGVHRALVNVAGAAVAQELARRKVSPADAALFAFGGGGGLYGAEIAESLGIPRVFCFEASSVFSAAGISGMDVGHVYEMRVNGSPADEQVAALRERAVLDARGEGFDPAELRFDVEVDDDGTGSGRLRAWIPMPPPAEAERATAGTDPAAARNGGRQINRSDGPVTATVYDREKLAAGNVVEGPALVEATDTTIVVPSGMHMTLDQYGTGVLSK